MLGWGQRIHRLRLINSSNICRIQKILDRYSDRYIDIDMKFIHFFSVDASIYLCRLSLSRYLRKEKLFKTPDWNDVNDELLSWRGWMTRLNRDAGAAGLCYTFNRVGGMVAIQLKSQPQPSVCHESTTKPQKGCNCFLPYLFCSLVES